MLILQKLNMLPNVGGSLQKLNMLLNVGGSLEISGSIDDDSLGRKKKHVRLSVEVLKPDGQDLEFQDLDGRTDKAINI
jgi:hypothetical protein